MENTKPYESSPLIQKLFDNIKKGLIELKQKEIDNAKKNHYPLQKDHICFKAGHNFFKLFEDKNHQSSWGTIKCSRCGYTEDYQYDK